MEINWLGHSCFRLKGKETTVITDPFHPDYGYQLTKVQSDIVTISHNHLGHNYTESLTGNPKILSGPGEYEVKNVAVTGVATFHDNENGKKLGKNTIFVFEMDGLVVCHLGDIGHEPAPEVLAAIGEIQILMVPVGENTTFPVKIAIDLIKDMAPRIIIPMHFKLPESNLLLEPVEKFLKEFGVKELAPTPKFSVTRSNLPMDSRVVSLSISQK